MVRAYCPLVCCITRKEDYNPVHYRVRVFAHMSRTKRKEEKKNDENNALYWSE